MPSANWRPVHPLLDSFPFTAPPSGTYQIAIFCSICLVNQWDISCIHFELIKITSTALVNSSSIQNILVGKNSSESTINNCFFLARCRRGHEQKSWVFARSTVKTKSIGKLPDISKIQLGFIYIPGQISPTIYVGFLLMRSASQVVLSAPPSHNNGDPGKTTSRNSEVSQHFPELRIESPHRHSPGFQKKTTRACYPKTQRLDPPKRVFWRCFCRFILDL